MIKEITGLTIPFAKDVININIEEEMKQSYIECLTSEMV